VGVGLIGDRWIQFPHTHIRLDRSIDSSPNRHSIPHMTPPQIAPPPTQQTYWTNLLVSWLCRKRRRSSPVTDKTPNSLKSSRRPSDGTPPLALLEVDDCCCSALSEERVGRRGLGLDWV
jgi:hypothetical protein